VGCGARSVRERNDRNPSATLRTGLGDPGDTWTAEVSRASTQDIWITSHERGNPETEVGQTLNEDERVRKDRGSGRQTRPKRRREANVAATNGKASTSYSNTRG